LPTSSCGSRRHQGKVLRSAWLDPRGPALSFKRPSPQERVGPTRRPQATRWLRGGFETSFCGALASVRRRGSRRTLAVRSSRDPSSSRGEGRVPLSVCMGTTKSESGFDGPCVSSDESKAKTGCSGVCPCIEVSCRSRWAAVGSIETRSAQRVNSTKRGDREDGGLAGGTKSSACERAPRAGSLRKHT